MQRDESFGFGYSLIFHLEPPAETAGCFLFEMTLYIFIYPWTLVLVSKLSVYFSVLFTFFP